MSKKKIYFQKQNHMDTLWRRCWDRTALYKGRNIRSYAQLEEMILDHDIELMDIEKGYVTSIEQAVTIRKYLEKNPDKRDHVRELIRNNNIELLNGGETIIDHNMVAGESIVRNFLYTKNWYEKEFGKKSSTCIVTDSFGVSGQMPQILRKLEYDYITQIGRVFENRKSFWKGIDGSLICFKDPTEDLKDKCGFVSLESYVKYKECSKCMGDGCEYCNYSGLDTNSYKFSEAALVNSSDIYSVGMTGEPVIKALEYARNSKFDEVTIYMSSEEIIKDRRIIELINEYRDRYALDISFMTKEEEYQRGTVHLRRLLADNPDAIRPEDIDHRPEGNCVCTGCYVSRIKLKQMVREAEGLLITAEKLATLAKINGMETYPLKKIEKLWNLMSMAQFHDAITSSHIDEAYFELLDILREVHFGSEKICQEATRYLNSRIAASTNSGGRTFVLYNTLSWNREGIHSLIVQLEDADNKCFEIVDDAGVRQSIVKISKHEWTENQLDIFKKKYAVKVDFMGSSIPAMGYRTFHVKVMDLVPKLEQVTAEVNEQQVLENEFYKISLDAYGISSIFDKKLGKEIFAHGVNELCLEEDYGSPWETLARPFNWTYLKKRNRVTSIVKGRHYDEAIIEGSYSENEDPYNGPNGVDNKLTWKQTITLNAGIRRIDFKTEIDWDTHSRRVKIAFPLGFESEKDEAWYEIPYGAIKRERYEGSFGIHTYPNGDWPALNWVEVENKKENYSLALLNKGLPCHRVEKGVMFLSVLRSPEMPVYIYNFEGARDTGKHVFEYSLTSHEGSLDKGRTSFMANELNMPEKAMEALKNNKGLLPGTMSFIDFCSEHSIITVLKMAEKEDAIILRINEIHGMNEKCAIHFNFNVSEIGYVNLLERGEQWIALNENAIQIDIRPFEIVSIKVKLQK